MILMDYVVVAAIIGVTVAWWLRNEAPVSYTHLTLPTKA